MKIIVRPAFNEEGEDIREIVASNGFLVGDSVVPWNDIEPYWLVAIDRDGDIVGCAQMMFSKPFGRLEYICADNNLTPSARSRIINKLIHDAKIALNKMGASGIGGSLPPSRRSTKRALKRVGGELVQGAIFLMD